MTLLLPVYSSLVLYGQLFDLHGYRMLARTPPLFDDDTISPFLRVTRINQLVAEYRFIDNEKDYRKFLGLDVASYLKTSVGRYDYRYRDRFLSDSELVSTDVYLALKLTLKTVNKSLTEDAPMINDCQLWNPRHEKTHYVKSIIHGYSIFQLLRIYPRYDQNISAIRESLLQRLGKHGRLNEEFDDKFHSALEENDVRSYAVRRQFGSVPPGIPRDAADMLRAKNELLRIMESGDEGHPLYYEMEALSFLWPLVGFVEVNRDIINQLYVVEEMYEDLRIASAEFSEWMAKIPWSSLSDEQMAELNNFREGLTDVERSIEQAIWNVDISTEGSLDQFAEAMNSYGNTVSTKKYRKKQQIFRQRFQKEIDTKNDKRMIDEI